MSPHRKPDPNAGLGWLIILAALLLGSIVAAAAAGALVAL